MKIKRIPPQTDSDLYLITSRSECMWQIVDRVSRGSVFYVSGKITNHEKLSSFANKMNKKFDVFLSPSGKAKRRGKGQPTAQLVFFQNYDNVIYWWILFAGSKKKIIKLTEKYGEVLRDSQKLGQYLTFVDDYILRRKQRTREQGGGFSWTWFMTKKVQKAAEAELRLFASGHGRKNERTDDLERAVIRLRQRPMFSGIRTQASGILTKTKRVWFKTHKKDNPYPGILDECLPFFSGRIGFTNKR